MQTQVPATPKEMLRAIKIVFFALIIGMSLFTVIIISLGFFREPPLKDKEAVRVFFIAVLFVAASCLSIANYLYKKRMTAAHDLQLSLMEKLNIYRAALILYLALCEGAGLFAVIIYFLTGSQPLIIAIVMILVAMLMKRPEKSRIFNDLQLSSQEQSELN
jgi:DMSO reductase anchor subunit